ncbi:hypothetical protein EST38_g6304 [Candolleomyces aberdarensis]|uniref:F-box domain-containing protein n=1 Tax=Candolleomyces aberdarensis TaxID=2316362 RepID=A0A4Q2DHX3_9AGAR|nr:hypothetical protein EST38_g6304 [Candolleomyces aberdarensis]
MPRARAAKRARRDVDTAVDSTSTATARAKAPSSTAAASGAGSNEECKFLELPSEILLEILSYFEPAVSLDAGEKALNVLYPNAGEDTTTPTAAENGVNNDDDRNNDNDNASSNGNSESDSDDNGNGNGNASNVNDTPVITYTYYYNEQRFLPGSAFSRTDALRALSQTCVAWRNFFWPMIWENVDLGSALRDGRGAWYRKLADGLIRKGRGIIGDAEVAKWVRRIRVVLTRCDISTVLPTLTSCLAACTNLQTLNIYFAHSEITTPLKEAFTGLNFPSVQTIVLPTQAHQVLRCCPNVKRVVCNDGDASQLISAVKAKCKDVEVFEGIRPSWKKDAMVKRLASAAPKLKEVRFEGRVEDVRL